MVKRLRDKFPYNAIRSGLKHSARKNGKRGNRTHLIICINRKLSNEIYHIRITACSECGGLCFFRIAIRRIFMYDQRCEQKWKSDSWRWFLGHFLDEMLAFIWWFFCLIWQIMMTKTRNAKRFCLRKDVFYKFSNRFFWWWWKLFKQPFFGLFKSPFFIIRQQQLLLLLLPKPNTPNNQTQSSF